MSSRPAVILSLAVLILIAAALGLYGFGARPDVDAPGVGDAITYGGLQVATGSTVAASAASSDAQPGVARVEQVDAGAGSASVRGVVVDGKSGMPLGGVEVIAQG